MHANTPLTMLATLLVAITLIPNMGFAQDDVYSALTNGQPSVNFDLRYEDVSQSDAANDAQALTLRTRLGYESGSFKGFSFNIEMEDNRIVMGQGDYSVGPTNYNVGIYPVIADPEFTELDQGYVQYKNNNLRVKVGRQVIALDGHRFIGHVGWRHDRQTFDAASFEYTPIKQLKAQYSYITQRNRIFGELADLDSKDHLFNLSYTTDYGTMVAYTYLLEVDNFTENALNTYGASFAGAKNLENTKIIYALEYATQTSENGAIEYDADYLFGELGATFSGITAKIGYEELGSDRGNFGFATPLATLHKFNGWSDQFLVTPSQGLQDTIFSLAGTAGSGNWLLAYHQYQADYASDTIDDLGNEIDLQYTIKIFDKLALGLKYASYSGDSGRADVDKIWVWLSTEF